jgi:hypothetical protein
MHRRRVYTDARFFLVYVLENSIRIRLLNLPVNKADALRTSGVLGWGGSRAVTMVRKEKVGLPISGMGSSSAMVMMSCFAPEVGSPLRWANGTVFSKDLPNTLH